MAQRGKGQFFKALVRLCLVANVLAAAPPSCSQELRRDSGCTPVGQDHSLLQLPLGSLAPILPLGQARKDVVDSLAPMSPLVQAKKDVDSLAPILPVVRDKKDASNAHLATAGLIEKLLDFGGTFRSGQGTPAEHGSGLNATRDTTSAKNATTQASDDPALELPQSVENEQDDNIIVLAARAAQDPDLAEETANASAQMETFARGGEALALGDKCTSAEVEAWRLRRASDGEPARAPPCYAQPSRRVLGHGKPCTGPELASWVRYLEEGFSVRAPHKCSPQGHERLFLSDLENEGRPQPAAFTDSDEAVYVTHMRVLNSNEALCRAPCKEISWELAAPKPTHDSQAQLLEVVHWLQENRITMYRFPPEFPKLALSEMHRGDYRSYREKHAVMSFPANFSASAKQVSERVRDVHAALWEKVVCIAPAKHYTLAYSGQGSYQGRLFDGLLDPDDAQQVLTAATEHIGHKLLLLNHGANSGVAHYTAAASFHPFADFWIATDLLRGGFEMIPWDPTAYVLHSQEIQLPHELCRKPILQALRGVLDLQKDFWLAWGARDMRAKKLPQNLHLFDFSKFGALAEALGAALRAASADGANPVERIYRETGSRDILFAVSRFPIKEKLKDAVNQTLRDFVVHTVDNRRLFQWEDGESGEALHANGLFFDNMDPPSADFGHFRGLSYSAPKCGALKMAGSLKECVDCRCKTRCTGHCKTFDTYPSRTAGASLHSSSSAAARPCAWANVTERTLLLENPHFRCSRRERQQAVLGMQDLYYMKPADDEGPAAMVELTPPNGASKGCAGFGPALGFRRTKEECKALCLGSADCAFAVLRTDEFEHTGTCMRYGACGLGHEQGGTRYYVWRKGGPKGALGLKPFAWLNATLAKDKKMKPPAA